MRASSTCCEITSTSCAKGCASTRKSRLSDRARDPKRGAAETAAALRDFNLAYVAVGSFTSFLPSRRVRFSPRADIRPKPAFMRTRPSARSARSETFRRLWLWLGCCAARQSHRKDRALARLARHRHVAAHHAGELAGDGEAEPG